MLLSDRDIINALQARKIIIEPDPNLEKQLGSCSIDFRLGNHFKIYEPHSQYAYIDLGEKVDLVKLMREICVEDNGAFTMQPGEFVLAGTKETLTLPNDLMARLEGRSSLGRLGIIVHSTAGVFDPGWSGVPTLELGNLGRIPVKLYPGMRICAFTFEQLLSPAMVPYGRKKGRKYFGQTGPGASLYHKELP